MQATANLIFQTAIIKFVLIGQFGNDCQSTLSAKHAICGKRGKTRDKAKTRENSRPAQVPFVVVLHLLCDRQAYAAGVSSANHSKQAKVKA